MNKIFRLLILFNLVFVVHSQAQRYQSMATWYEFNRAKFASMLRLPLDTISGADSGSIAYIRSANKLYIKAGYWQELTGSGGGANNFSNSLSFDSVTGNLVMGRSGLSNLTASMNGRYLLRFGGYNSINVPDSSFIFKLTNNLKLGTKYNQFVLSNVDYSLIPSIYQAKGGSHDGNFNPSQLLLVRKFMESANDSLFQMSYGGAATAYSEYRADSNSTRWRYDNKYFVLPNMGFYSDARLYAPRDSLELRTNGNGQSGAGMVAALSIGDVWGYKLRINSTQYNPYPLALSIATLDLMRNDSRGRKRQITGNYIAGYVSDWKNYQYGDITSGTSDDSSYFKGIVDFYSMGSRNDSVGLGVTKAKIMGVSKVDYGIGFFSRKKYSPLNEVWNGFGFYQEGTEDYNYYQGRIQIGGAEPNRNSGGIPYNLLVNGTFRSDTAYNKFTKYDSLGSIQFTAKNDPSFNGRYLLQVNQTLDASANSTNVAGGVRSYRNWLDPTSIGIPEPTIDSRNYFRIQAGRTETLANCNTCSMAEYFGYKQVILGANARVNYSGVTPTVFWARNEINGTTVGSNGKATEFGMTGYRGQYNIGPRVDSVGFLSQFEDVGFITNTASYITGYASFYMPLTWQSNIGNMWGLYQEDKRIKNRLAGKLLLGSSINFQSKDSIPFNTTVGAIQMLGVDSVSGDLVRMPVPSGGGGSDGNNFPTGITFNAVSRALSIQRIGLSDISTVLPIATTSAAGLMDSLDRKRLDSSTFYKNGSANGFKTMYGVSDSLFFKNAVAKWGMILDSTTTGEVGYKVDSATIHAWINTFAGSGGMADPSVNGILSRTALNTTVARTITGTTGKIVVTNGDGVSGNPTINVGSDVAIVNANNTFSAVNTFTSNDVTFSSVSPLINGTGALKFQDGNDGKNFSMSLNTRKLLLTAQQSSFSYQDVGYWMVDAPANAFSLWSTGTWRLNTTSTVTDIISSKFALNGSMWMNKDSAATVTPVTGDWVMLLDPTTNKVKKANFSSFGGGGLSGLSNNAVLKATSTTTVGSSTATDDYTNFILGAGVAISSTQTVTSGTSSTIGNGIYRYEFDPASLIASYTVTMPASPVDGQQLIIRTGKTMAAGATAITSFTVSPNAGQSIFGAITPTSLAIGDVLMYEYELGNTTWYRIK